MTDLTMPCSKSLFARALPALLLATACLVFATLAYVVLSRLGGPPFSDFLGLRSALRLTPAVLLWPGSAFARIGIGLSFLLAPLVLICEFLLVRFAVIRVAPRLSRITVVVLVLVAHWVLGCVYVFSLPVPLPASGVNVVYGAKGDAEVVRVAYELGYRVGMTNTIYGFDGVQAPGFSEAYWLGYYDGLGEHQRVYSMAAE